MRAWEEERGGNFPSDERSISTDVKHSIYCCGWIFVFTTVPILWKLVEKITEEDSTLFVSEVDAWCHLLVKKPDLSSYLANWHSLTGTSNSVGIGPVNAAAFHVDAESLYLDINSTRLDSLALGGLSQARCAIPKDVSSLDMDNFKMQPLFEDRRWLWICSLLAWLFQKTATKLLNLVIWQLGEPGGSGFAVFLARGGPQVVVQVLLFVAGSWLANSSIFPLMTLKRHEKYADVFTLNFEFDWWTILIGVGVSNYVPLCHPLYFLFMMLAFFLRFNVNTETVENKHHCLLVYISLCVVVSITFTALLCATITKHAGLSFMLFFDVEAMVDASNFDDGITTWVSLASLSLCVSSFLEALAIPIALLQWKYPPVENNGSDTKETPVVSVVPIWNLGLPDGY